MFEMRTESFRLRPSHTDFLVACDQAGQARRLGNTLNFIAHLVYGPTQCRQVTL